MAEEFLKLPRAEQAEIIQAVASRSGRSPSILEKDLWVCWVLAHLFSMPNRQPMAFKGGTSLSKVFNALSRFSEDIDVTLDYRGHVGDFDPFAKGVSKSKIKTFCEIRGAFVRAHSHEVIGPYFREAMRAQFDVDENSVVIDEKGEEIRISYPGIFVSPENGYLKESVLLELGGRNITEPSQEHEIRPVLADAITGLDFPVAFVNVLSPSRTFWEKATLIHVECNRKEHRAGNSERLSRHWCDLAILGNHDIGQIAIQDRGLLADVVKHKKVFFHSAFADYDSCLSGGFRLVPDSNKISVLRLDFERMLSAGMFFSPPPSFDEIIERLRKLEEIINR